MQAHDFALLAFAVAALALLFAASPHQTATALGGWSSGYSFDLSAAKRNGGHLQIHDDEALQ
jgi:hypothetical protein